jgi:hypothetical protein
MTNRVYAQTIQRIERVYELLSVQRPDEYLVSVIAAQICIMQSGILENILKEVFSEYCDRRSCVEVASYMKKGIAGIRNPRADRIEDLVGGFSNKWKSDLEVYWADNEVRAHVNSVISNRHLLAHGRTTAITISQTKEWLKSIKKLADFMESTFAS